MDIALSVAELAVLMAAADMDPAPFVRESSLMALGPDELRDRLELARAAVVSRHLAAANNGGPMQVAPAVRNALKRLARPRQAFELMHAQRGARPVRTQFGLSPDGLSALRHGADDERILATDVARVDIAAEAQATWVGAATAPGPEYVVPAAVVSQLAAPNGAEEGALLRLLADTGMGAEDAASFLAAGVRPERQTVFAALAMDDGRVRAQAIMWFAGSGATWLLAPMAADASAAPRFVAGRAGSDDVRRAVEALIAAA